MAGYFLRRLPSLIFVLAASLVVAFFLPRMAPGDPAVTIAGPDASLEEVEAVRQSLHLDRPLIEQFFTWVSGLFTGDFGASYVQQRPITELVGARLESTVELAALAALFMIIIGLLLGVLGGSKLSAPVRAGLDVFTTLMLAIPPFLLALMLILIVGIWLNLLPVSGEVVLSEDPLEGFRYLILPAFAMALTQAAVIARLLQTSMQTTRGEQFVDLAIAKGASSTRVTWRHVLRPSLDAAIVAIGLRIGELLSGAIILEALFARNGLGQLTVQATVNRDYPVIQILIVLAVLVAVAFQLLSELAMAAVDPRTRLDS